MSITRKSRKIVFENRWVRLYEDEITHPDGTDGTYTWAEREEGRGGAIVIPRLPDGRLLLLKVHRHVPGKWSWEFPGGGVDSDETLEQGALRELCEETGLKGSKPRNIGSYSSDAGFFRETHNAFVIDIPAGSEQQIRLDEGESIIDYRLVTEQQAWKMVSEGEMFNGTNVTALALYRVNGQGAGESSPAGTQPRRVRAKLMYDSPWWRLYEDDIERRDGSAGIYVRVRTASGGGAVLVVPRTPSGRHLLIKIYRYPVDRELWEFPAGLVEAGEDPLNTAVRELEEETGLAATSARMIGTQFPVAGLMSDLFYTVLAEVSEAGLQDLSLQAEEGILAAKWATLDELRAMVQRNEIMDNVTLGAVARLLAVE